MWKMFLSMLIIVGCVSPSVASKGQPRCGVASSATIAPITYVAKVGQRIEAAYVPQLLSSLNAGGAIDTLPARLEASAGKVEQPAIHAQVFESNITGGTRRELLISLNLTWGSTYEHLLSLFACEADHYVLLDSLAFNQFFDINNAPGATIETVMDMNGDKRPEIVMREGLVAQKNMEAVTIFAWEGTHLAQIFSTGFDLGDYPSVKVRPSETYPAQYDLVIENWYGYGQAVAIAVIEITHWRPIIEIYAWNGHTFVKSCQYFTDVPTTLYETLHSAETLRACSRYADAEVLYRQMIDDHSLKRWSSAFALDIPADERSAPTVAGQMEANYLISFAFFRLIELRLQAGDAADAETLLQTVTSAYPSGVHGYQYAAMSTALIKAYKQSHQLDAACKAAKTAFDTAKKDGSDPGIPYLLEEGDPNAHIGFYWDNGKINSADPDNLFSVPPGIADMISIPVCLM